MAAGLASATMVMSPVAQGAKQSETQKERVAEFLKTSQLNSRKPLTVGEFHRRMRMWYPLPARNLMDVWATRYRDELMPKVDTSVIKDSEGNEQVRLLFSKDGESVSMTTGDGFLRIGKVKVTAKDYYNIPGLLKRVQEEDPYFTKRTKGQPSPFRQVTTGKIIPTNKEFSRMNNMQRAYYLLQLRHTVEVADRIIDAAVKHQQSKTSSFIGGPAEALWAMLLRGDNACASLANQTCIVAGYLSKYDERGRSCGGETSGMADFTRQISGTLSTFGASKCANGSNPGGPDHFACNPIVYGLASPGKAYCVPKASIKSATRHCGAESPLDTGDYNANRKRIVMSWAQGLGQGLNEEDFFVDGEGTLRLKKAKHDIIRGQLEALRNHIQSAQSHCAVEPIRGDQKEACEELLRRMFALEELIEQPQPPEPIPQPPAECSGISGASFNADTQACECAGNLPPNTRDDGSQSCESAVPPIRDEAPKKEEKKNNWLLPVILIGGALLVACLFFFCKKKDKKPGVPTPVPPVDPPGPVDPPPVEPPPPPPPPPPVIPDTEGGTGSAPDTSGGVR